jgi:alpha 1,3-glucosidase
VPLFHMLGFNYCMWSYNLSADIMLERDRLFTVNKIPVDVLWMDIEWSQNYKFFIFDNKNFP